jgi:hypothetical protein
MENTGTTKGHIHIKDNDCNRRAVGAGVARDAAAPPDFGRSFNPI